MLKFAQFLVTSRHLTPLLSTMVVISAARNRSMVALDNFCREQGGLEVYST